MMVGQTSRVTWPRRDSLVKEIVIFMEWDPKV